jgi:hypothetical protein
MTPHPVDEIDVEGRKEVNEGGRKGKGKDGLK